MKRRGLASITSLVMLTLVAAALMAMSTRFADDARRTVDRATDAQLRQLLVAAATAVQQGDDTLALPAAVAEDFAVTFDTRIDGDVRTVTITARGIHQAERQVLIYTRDGGGWRLDEARLNPDIARANEGG